MEGVATQKTLQNDVFFQCRHCGIPLVVDGGAAGMTLTCQRCGKPAAVPPISDRPPESSSAMAAPTERLAELERHLKENDSQRTEVRGYINQLGIQLHRWQLRLQTLEERNKDLTGEIVALQPGT